MVANNAILTAGFTRRLNRIVYLLEDDYYIVRNDTIGHQYQHTSDNSSNSLLNGSANSSPNRTFVQQAYKFIFNNLVMVGQKIINSTEANKAFKIAVDTT